MKKTIPILAGIAVFLAVLCVVQSKKLGKQQTQVSSLNQELTEKSKRLDEIQQSAAATNAAPAQPVASDEPPASPQSSPPTLETNHRQRTPAPIELSPAAETGATNEVASSKSTNDLSAFSKMLSQMMQDPETKKMLREQQRVALDQLYSPLVKQLGLTPEESGKLKDLLADQMMEGSAMLFGNQGSKGNELLASSAASQTSLDEKVKELLGDDRYAQFKDYQLTVGDRMQLTQFKQMVGDNPLTDQQTDQLLAIIKEEKKNVAGPNGEAFSGFSQNNKATMDAMLSDDAMEKLLQSQDELNQRVFQRANDVLSPDQLSAFGKFQTNQTAMMRLGVTMARKMFSPDREGGAGQGK